MIPEFAILGHPNEGKSSVLSTLSEDDSVRISATPGETVECRVFPVSIDGKEIIKFTDTPGFQNPQRMLSELQKYSDLSDAGLEEFFKDNHSLNEMHDDCELLRPLLRGAGIIYVADGSRPIRNVDLAEMEILRLTGKPRMAILNCKDEEEHYLDQWKTEFRRHFNSSRIFNAHSATYIERIRLLEALKSIEQDWHGPLDLVVASFKKDWQSRNNRTVTIICEMLSNCLSHSVQSTIAKETATETEREKLYLQYSKDIKKLELDYHQRIRKVFKHNIFNYSLPPQSILNDDLFDQQTWKFLGLKQKQIALAGGAGGAAIAAGLDLAAGGASLGVFTSIGGIIGALGALYGGKNIAAKTRVLGVETGRYHLQVGPNENPQFPYILLDRALIFYSHTINWAHGRRDYDTPLPISEAKGYSRDWPVSSLKKYSKYFSALQKKDKQFEKYERAFTAGILECLKSISSKDPGNKRNITIQEGQ